MTNCVAWTTKYDVGDTINLFGGDKFGVNPFKNIMHYSEQFKHIQTEAKKEINIGEFSYKSDIVQNMSMYNESLNIGGTLSANVGIVGADAEIDWHKSKSMNSNDIRLLIQANYKQRSICNYIGTLKLELAQYALDNMIKFDSLDQFKQKYGSHLIIGVQNGSKATYMLTYAHDEKTE
eukprot:134099_1